jgi:hypothetical protein
MEGGFGDDQSTLQSQTQSQGAVDKTASTAFLNVPPVEAERRRQTAVELLTGKGIDPATLSTEQFNIFANQAPNLQSASLDMLAKYGAERLRIVHPDEKEQVGSSNSTPSKGQAANASPAAAPALPTGSTHTPTKRPRTKKKKNPDGPLTEVPIGNGAVVSMDQDGELGTTESALKPRATRKRKTRGRCDTCKQRNVQVGDYLNLISKFKLNLVLCSVRKSIRAAPSALETGLIAYTCSPSRGGNQKMWQKWWSRITPNSQMIATLFSMKQRVKGRRQCHTRRHLTRLPQASRLRILRTRNLYLIQTFFRGQLGITQLLHSLTTNTHTMGPVSHTCRAPNQQLRLPLCLVCHIPKYRPMKVLHSLPQD